MNPADKPALNDTQSIQLLPRWITLTQDETPETFAFLSGAALATLDVGLRDPNGTLPGALLRDRMALDAAVVCLKLEGRNKTASISAMRCVWRGQSDWGGQGTPWDLLVRCLWRGASWRG
jgi:hypothetical protein